MDHTPPIPEDPRTEEPASRRIPVRTKITLPFLLVAIGMAVLAGFILYQVLFENLDHRFNTRLIESGKLGAEWMVQEERAQLANLRLLAHTDGVGTALLTRNAETLRRATLGNVIGNQLDAVEFLDADGRLVLSMHHRPGSLYVEDYVFATTTGTDFRGWSFVDNVVMRRTDAHGDKFAGLAKAPWGDYLYVSGPVYDAQQRFAGVILVGEGLAPLVRKMRMEVGAQFTLYDLDGQPLAGTLDAPRLAPDLAEAILKQQATESLRRDGTGGRRLAYNGIDYGELLGPWKLRGGQDTGLIGTAIPKDFLLRTSTSVRIQLAALVGLALALVIILGSVIAHRITRPLVALVEASQAVSKGDLGRRVACQSNDEIADLADHFNRMTGSIQQSHRDLLRAYDSTLEGWSRATDLRDNETERHMRNVIDLTIRLASRLGYRDGELVTMYRGALLHDVGKIGVPDSILKKPGALTPEERVEMERHTQHAFDILSPIEYLGEALLIPYYHHERWDGTGYPIGLKGEEIPESARIFAIVDVWDAMTSDRVYRKAMSQDDVVFHLLESRGTHFEPRIVDAFLDMIGKEPSSPEELP